MLYSAVCVQRRGNVLAVRLWLTGAVHSTHTWKVNVEREVVPTDCRSEVGDELMPAGASAFVIPADSLCQ